MTYALETRKLSKRFGGLVATNNVSFRLKAGSRHALIGPNGAGKTTFVNQLTGALKADEGQVLMNGTDLTHLSQAGRTRLGLGRTHQINQLFQDMTPIEAITFVMTESKGLGSRLVGRFGADGSTLDEAVELAGKLKLLDVLTEPTKSLAYGKRRLLELGLALAGKPRVLLMDEPAAGVPEADRLEILETLAELPETVSILLIEHDMGLVQSFADHITVLVNGTLFVDGTPDEVLNHQGVREVYLGNSRHG